jgi:hypothetical protein
LGLGLGNDQRRIGQGSAMCPLWEIFSYQFNTFITAAKARRKELGDVPVLVFV